MSILVHFWYLKKSDLLHTIWNYRSFHFINWTQEKMFHFFSLLYRGWLVFELNNIQCSVWNQCDYWSDVKEIFFPRDSLNDKYKQFYSSIQTYKVRHIKMGEVYSRLKCDDNVVINNNRLNRLYTFDYLKLLFRRYMVIHYDWNIYIILLLTILGAKLPSIFKSGLTFSSALYKFVRNE